MWGRPLHKDSLVGGGIHKRVLIKTMGRILISSGGKNNIQVPYVRSPLRDDSLCGEAIVYRFSMWGCIYIRVLYVREAST